MRGAEYVGATVPVPSASSVSELQVIGNAVAASSGGWDLITDIDVAAGATDDGGFLTAISAGTVAGWWGDSTFGAVQGLLLTPGVYHVKGLLQMTSITGTVPEDPDDDGPFVRMELVSLDTGWLVNDDMLVVFFYPTTTGPALVYFERTFAVTQTANYAVYLNGASGAAGYTASSAFNVRRLLSY